MERQTRTFRVPDDLGEETGHDVQSTSDGALVLYKNREGMQRQWVFVCAPTVVHVRCGEKYLEVEGRRCVVRAGEVALMRRGLYVMSEVVDGEAPYTSTLLSVRDDFLAEFHKRHPHAHRADASAERPWNVLTPSAYLLRVFEQLPEVLQGAPHPNLLGVKIEELLLAMQEPQARMFWRAATQEAMSSGDARLRDTITRHAFTGVNTTELASLSGRSLSSFKRDFVRLYGVSPGRWLLEHRLEHAAGMLSNNECNVTEACWRSGFSDVSSFIRAFKRLYHTTPKQFQLMQAPGV